MEYRISIDEIHQSHFCSATPDILGISSQFILCVISMMINPTSAPTKSFKAQSPCFYVFIFWPVLILVTNIRSCFNRSEQTNPIDATVKVTR